MTETPEDIARRYGAELREGVGVTVCPPRTFAIDAAATTGTSWRGARDKQLWRRQSRRERVRKMAPHNTAEEIAAVLSCGLKTVYEDCREMGVKPKSPRRARKAEKPRDPHYNQRRSDEARKKWADLAARMTVAEIVAETGTSARTVRAALLRYGLKARSSRRKRNRKGIHSDVLKECERRAAEKFGVRQHELKVCHQCTYPANDARLEAMLRQAEAGAPYWQLAALWETTENSVNKRLVRARKKRRERGDG